MAKEEQTTTVNNVGQLQGLNRFNTHVTADMVNSGGGWPNTGRFSPWRRCEGSDWLVE